MDAAPPLPQRPAPPLPARNRFGAGEDGRPAPPPSVPPPSSGPAPSPAGQGGEALRGAPSASRSCPAGGRGAPRPGGRNAAQEGHGCPGGSSREARASGKPPARPPASHWVEATLLPALGRPTGRAPERGRRGEDRVDAAALPLPTTRRRPLPEAVSVTRRRGALTPGRGGCRGARSPPRPSPFPASRPVTAAVCPAGLF